jgi:hypothetical protein
VLSLHIPSRHAVLFDRGKSIGCICSVPSPMTLAFALNQAARHSRDSHHPLPMGVLFAAHGFTLLRPVELLAPLADLTGNFHPAIGGLYSRASDELVTLLVVGYNYGGF